MRKHLVLLILVILSVALFAQEVSVSFFQEPLAQALNDLATQENITILTDSTIGGFVTLNLENVPLSEVLDLMLLPGGYSWKEIKPGVYFVGTAMPSSNSFLYLASMTTYRLKHITASTLINLLPKVMKPYVFTTTDSPQLVVIGAPEKMKDSIISLIKSVDVAKREAVFQVNVVEVNESYLKKLGMDLQWSKAAGNATETTFNVLSRTINVVYKLSDLSILSSIRAEAENGVAKVLASPKIRVVSGNTATFKVSTVRIYTYTSGGKTVVSNVNVGINISLTPTISASGDVSMKFSETLNSAMENAGPVPDTMTNTLSTVFDTKLGESVAVGGMDFSTYEKSTAKVPLLGDIPILGYFFTQDKMKKVKKEIMVIITCESVGGE